MENLQLYRLHPPTPHSPMREILIFCAPRKAFNHSIPRKHAYIKAVAQRKRFPFN